MCVGVPIVVGAWATGERFIFIMTSLGIGGLLANRLYENLTTAG